jgi:PAS domain S-box-containing protein
MPMPLKLTARPLISGTIWAWMMTESMGCEMGHTMQAEWLPVIMHGSLSEIYVIDCETLRFVEINPSACMNLQYSASELIGKTLADIATHLTHDMLRSVLQPLRKDLVPQAALTLNTTHARKDGSVYPVELRLFYCASSLPQVFIAIGNDIGFRHEAAEALAQSVEWSAHMETVKEKERTRIAREIHDDLGGNLTGIKMALASLVHRLPGEDRALIEKAGYVDSLVDRTLEAVHRIAGDLCPAILDLGLGAAIDWQAKEFEKQSGISCVFSSNKTEIDLHPDQATALFRVFQEALTNVGKHAQASHVSVRLVHARHSIELEITDNGLGIATSDRLKPKSFGIRGMVERVHALGGNLLIGAAPQGGTVVEITVPLADPAD